MGNPTSNKILERIYSFLDNFVWTYNIKDIHIYEDDPRPVIIVASLLLNLPNANMLKGFTLGQLIFGRDMIILIIHK